MEQFRALIAKLHELPLPEACERVGQFVMDSKGDRGTIRLLVNSFDESCASAVDSFRLSMFLHCPDEVINQVLIALKIPFETYYYELVNINEPDVLDQYCTRMAPLLPLDQEKWQFLIDCVTTLQREDEDIDMQLGLCRQQLHKFFMRQTTLVKPTWIVAARTEPLSKVVDLKPFVALDQGFDASMKESLENRDLAREFGILNKRKSVDPSDFDPDHLCCKYGGCRMLICNDCHRYVEDEFDAPDEWFTGRCDYCKREISHEHWAIREPLINGGWLGCYCGFQCLKKGATEDHPLQLELFRHLLEAFGVHDRE